MGGFRGGEDKFAVKALLTIAAGFGSPAGGNALHLYQMRGSPMAQQDILTDDDVAEFLDLARSANVRFELVHGRLHMRMVNPIWSMWTPIRHLLDEIGLERIEAYARRETSARDAMEKWNHATAVRLHSAAELMRG